MKYKLLPTFYEAAHHARRYAFKSGIVTSVKRVTSGWVVVPYTDDSYTYNDDNFSWDPLAELDNTCRTLPLRELENELYLSFPDSKEHAIISSHINRVTDPDSDYGEQGPWYDEGNYYFSGTLYVDHSDVGAVYFLDKGRGDPNTHVLTVHPHNEAALAENLEKLERISTRNESTPDIRLKCRNWNEDEVHYTDSETSKVYIYNRIIAVEESSDVCMIDGRFMTSDLIVTLEFEKSVSVTEDLLVDDLGDLDY